MTNSTATAYNEPDALPFDKKESLLTPGANTEFLVWLIVLGIPALLMFLIYARQLDAAPVPTAPVVMEEHRD